MVDIRDLSWTFEIRVRSLFTLRITRGEIMGDQVALKKFVRMPGIQSIEDKKRLGTINSSTFEILCYDASMNIFGIWVSDVQDLFKDVPDEDFVKEVLTKFHCERFSDPEDKVACLRELGWDFTDDYGKPLLVTNLFCLQAEAIARGYFAAPANLHEVSAESWGSALEAEARNFKRQKR